MPRPSTLVDTIRRCPAFTSAYRLASWVDEGKRVTPKQVLRPVDVPGAAQVLGISVPARIRTASDMPALHRPWTLALTVGLLRIVDGHARPGPALAQWSDSDDDTVCELWLAALATVFARALPEADEAEAIMVVRVMLTALATDPPAPFADMWHRAREALDVEDSDAAYWFHTGWVGRADPLAALDPLIELGAVVRHGSDVSITPLGHWASEQMQARLPKPITADLSAAEVLARLADIEQGERWRAAHTWLGDRAPLHAARDLLHAADAATPAQRIAAVDLVYSLESPADAVWDEVTALPNLAAHARAIADGDLSAQDSAWLAVEYAAAALSDSGPDQALSRLDEMVPGDGLASRLRTVECAAHPATAELAEALTAFLSSGATPTCAQAVQLKISLNRMRHPVWRRVLMPATASLGMLHEVIQIVMGWDGDHLHAFTVGQRAYGDPFNSPDTDDEEGLRCSVAFAARENISYLYDFGDRWEHTIKREKVLDLTPDMTYPVCVAGKGGSPVEDWTSGPESIPFDQDAINRRLAEIGALQDQ